MHKGKIMIRNLITTVLFLLLSTAAFAEPHCAIVTMGSADVDVEGGPPNNWANLSFIAVLSCDYTVTGRLQDTFDGGVAGIHAELTCLVVEGNDAWMSGIITKVTPAATFGDLLVGQPIGIRVRDNGTSANDPPDESSFLFFTLDANDCLNKPNAQLFDLNNGQVQIRE